MYKITILNHDNFFNKGQKKQQLVPFPRLPQLLLYAYPYLQNTSKDDCNDETIDGDSLTEDNGDKILGLDARGTDTTTNDAHTGSVNTPGEKNRRVFNPS